MFFKWKHFSEKITWGGDEMSMKICEGMESPGISPCHDNYWNYISISI